MKINVVVVGRLETNCYVLEKDGEVLIVDPGDDFEKIKKTINGKVKGILVTHNHFDHIGALDECVKYFNVPVYDKNNLIEGRCEIGKFIFEVKYNFGHTMDSISFIFDNIMFSGDFIFSGAIGRCDLGGDFFAMKNSIKDILNSNINYKICPGHGEFTYLESERNLLLCYVK